MSGAGALLAGIDPATFLMLMAVCFVAAALSGLSGFGAGLIITVFITPIIGAAAVIPVLSVLMLFTNLSRVWFFRGALDRRLLGLLAAGAMPGAALGALVYVRLEATTIEVLLGLVLVLSIPLRRWLKGRALAPGGSSLLAFGGVFGFLSSVVVGAGVLVIPILLGAGLAGPALLVTDAALAVLVNLVKIAMFGRLEALTLPLFAASLAMGLCTVPGTWAGAWIVRRTSLRLHTVLMELLVVGYGASLLWRAARPALAG
ncbi:MAG TPA: sulfite exporter TauE/SafE family protein [Geminicoccaceae bacterium]|nr:sulfite exporter TauE/SafE family protein [Geminicoccaceae bacterium]